MEQDTTEKPSWFHTKWRPATAWLYLVICFFDFMGAPLLLAAFQDHVKMLDWRPYTLQGAGLFHMSMLAIIGVTAWGRTQEKLQGITKSD